MASPSGPGRPRSADPLHQTRAGSASGCTGFTSSPAAYRQVGRLVRRGAAAGRTSEATGRKKQWPATQRTRACSIGPSVLDRTCRARTSAGTPHSGQVVMSTEVPPFRTWSEEQLGRGGLDRARDTCWDPGHNAPAVADTGTVVPLG